MTITVRYFVSHSWAYSNHYETLNNWINGTPWNLNGEKIMFIDCSIPQDDPIHNAYNDAELLNVIFKWIASSNVVAIPTGMYANYSKWIGKEINCSQRCNVPILAVNPWGQEKNSSVVQDAATETVGWNRNSFVQTLFRLARNS